MPQVRVHGEPVVLSLGLFISWSQSVACPLIMILPREETGERLRVNYIKWTLWMFFAGGPIKVIVSTCVFACVRDGEHVRILQEKYN